MWLIAGLVAAIGTALQNVVLKKSSVHYNSFIITWSLLVVSAILYIPLLFGKIPPVSGVFWVIVIIRIIFDSIAMLLYVEGIKRSPLSLTVPMMSFLPLFLLFASFFINHLFPTLLGLIGVFITMFGIYLLNFDHDTKHILSPFHAIWREKGVLFIILATFFWGIVDSLKRTGIELSNTNFYTAIAQIVWAIFFSFIVIIVARKDVYKLLHSTKWPTLLPVGILDAIQVYAFNIAVILTLPVYAQSVTNTEILFSSLFGWMFLKEKIQKHIIPTLIILIGIILITIAQG